MSETTIQRTQDERVAAALAHGSVLLSLLTGGLGGFIGATMVWLAQKDQSRYVAFQALQSIVFQTLFLVVSILETGCYQCAIFLPLIPLLVDPKIARNVPLGVWTCGIFCPLPVLLLLDAVFVIYGLYGAWRTLGGADFRYAIIGRMIERRLEADTSK